jgi:hypothetical protein
VVGKKSYKAGDQTIGYTDDRELQGFGHEEGRLRWGQGVGSDLGLIGCRIKPREIKCEKITYCSRSKVSEYLRYGGLKDQAEN